MPEKDIQMWQLVIGTVISWAAMFMGMMGFNYRWIQNATNKDCVLKPDCLEDRKQFLKEIQIMREESKSDINAMRLENKADFQRLYDKIEK